MATSIAVGDVNHDGRADVVVSKGNSIEIFLQNASGALDPGISYSANSYSVKIADLNNDGLSDVVSMGWATDSVDVFLQNINGILDLPISYNIGSYTYREVDVGDVNNDGLTDIIVVDSTGGVGTLVQNPDGTFGPVVYYHPPGSTFTHGIAVGDLNDDNLQDIVVTYGGNQPNSKIGIFSQNLAGTFDPAASYDSYDVPGAVVVADLDNDGKKDIIINKSRGANWRLFSRPSWYYITRGNLPQLLLCEL